MVFGGLMAVACYISANPSPRGWIVSGPPSEVAALEAVAKTLPSIRQVAHASDGPIAFARFELAPHTKYKEFMLLMAAVGPTTLRSDVKPTVRDCADGRAEDIGDSYASPVMVGIIAESEDMKSITAELSWVAPSPVRFTDGRVGIGFEPGPDEAEQYQKSVAKAARGQWRDAQIVLMETGHP